MEAPRVEQDATMEDDTLIGGGKCYCGEHLVLLMSRQARQLMMREERQSWNIP